MINLYEYLELLNEWDFSRNRDKDISYLKLSKKYWWICRKDKGHKWEATLSHRKTGRGCPYCARQKFLKEESFGFLFPNLLKEWDFDKNKINPYETSPKSSKRVWWVCENNHSWCALINPRTIRNVGCPYCAGKLPTDSNNLLLLFPDIVLEWDYEKNNADPKQILPNSNKKMWWICSKNPNHKWKCSVNNRVSNKSSCPYCAGQKVLKEESFGSLFPDLMKEWDFDKNELDPYKLSVRSSKKTWWICKHNHSWSATINHRTNGSSCPYCSKRVSKSGKKWLDELGICEREMYINIKGKKLYVDGFDPETNTIYEYFGNYWHGNPDIYNPNDINPSVGIKFGKLYERTSEKISLIKSAGYNIIYKWGD